MVATPGKAHALRQQADQLRRQLRDLEVRDWPRWLQQADAVTREISELLRRAAELEQGRTPQQLGGARSGGSSPSGGSTAYW